MNVKEYLEQVKSENISVVENTAKIIEETKKINKTHHYFNTISEELALDSAKKVDKGIKSGKLRLLSGLPISVKDCLCVKGIESTAGSKILSGYKPVFNAHVIDNIQHEGGIVIGKTSQDEFGFGSFNVNVGVGMKIPLNPHDKDRCTGGSSGGAAGFTAYASKKKIAHIAVGESTGGSIESPSSFCGTVGFCPTYGRVSRYGLISYANSLDKIGPITENVYDTALLLDVIKGYDKRDSTSIDLNKKEKFTDYLDKGVKNLKVGVIKEAFGEGIDDDVKNAVQNGILTLESAGAKIEDVKLPFTLEYSIPTYYLIAMSEASSNLARYCGLRYGATEKMDGNFNEFFSNVRSDNFGTEAKRRIMLGTFTRMAGYRDAYYIKATKIRTKIIEEYKKAFKHYDILVSPTMPTIAPKFSEIEKMTPIQNYMMDVLTAGPNLAGIPHASINVGESKGMPIGMMVMGDHFDEDTVLRALNVIELDK